MNRLKLLATATLVALAFTACDEGTPPPVEPPPPPTPVGTISGSVTIEGTAAAGITATLSSGATTSTGAGGNFAFAGVEAGTYTVTISGFPEDATFAQVTQSATIASDGQNVQLNFAGEYIRSSAVVGNVVAADAVMSGGDGQPETLAGVTVTLGGEHAMGETMETGMDGGFAFTGLRAGTYTVTISNFPEDVSFETVSVEVEVEVGEVGSADFTGHFIRTSAVEGQVIIDGEGLQGVLVTLAGGPADENFTMTTDVDGMYRFEDLRPGDYTVSISDFDTRDYEFAATSQDVSVDLDETGTVSFTGVLLRTSGISGRVSVEGMGLGDIAVTLSGAADASTTTDAGGQYAFSGLAAGDYTVTIAVESAAYVFDAMSMDRTVGDDESAIVNFEGQHARTASVSGQAFLDELDKNNMMDAGEHPLAAAGIPVALVGPGVNDQRLSATGPDGSFSFGGLRAGSYQLVVPIDATTAAALAASDVAYGGPGTGYAFALGVGEAKSQAVPFDITHTTVNFSVSLRSGDDMGDALPGASVSLYGANSAMVGSGMTGDDGSVAIKVARAMTSGNMVNAGVSAEGYDVAEGMTAVSWDPQMFATSGANSNDIVNLNVNVNISGRTVETGHPDSGQPLAGWAIDVMMGGTAVADAPTELGSDGSAALMTAVESVPASFTFAVADDQDDKLDGGESYDDGEITYTHDGLSVAGDAMDADAIEVRFTTQTLKVYVYEELDQVYGYTGNVGHSDRRAHGLVNLEVRHMAANGRSRPIPSDQWDAEENSSGSKGAYTFSHLPANAKVFVVATPTGTYKVMDRNRLDTYRDMEDNGVMGGAFGEMGGFGHTVSLCPLTETEPTGQDFGKCGSFAVVATHAVHGQVWKNGVRRSGDGFSTTDSRDQRKSGITVSLMPVEGKNLEGDGRSYTTASSDNATTPLDERKQFDFDRMAAGTYELELPSGWRAMKGEAGEAESLGGALDPLEGDLQLDITPSTGTLYGIVSNPDGIGLQGVTVTVNGMEAVTDDLGRYIVSGFKAVRGQLFVNTVRAGYPATKPDSTKNSKTAVPEFAANTVTEHNITLSGANNTVAIRGTVTESGTGAPIKGVEILVDGKAPLNKGSNGKLLTGDDGRYTAVIEPQPFDDPLVYVTGKKTGWHFLLPAGGYPVPAIPGSTSTADFQGTQATSVTGRVTMPGGNRPMSDVTVTAWNHATARERANRIASVTTSATGTFSVPVNTLSGSVWVTAEPRSDYTPSSTKYQALVDAENYVWFDPPVNRTGGQMVIIPGQSAQFGTFKGYSIQPRITRVRRPATTADVEGTGAATRIKGEPSDTIEVTWAYDTRSSATTDAYAADGTGAATPPTLTSSGGTLGETPSSTEADARPTSATDGVTSVTHTRTTDYVIGATEAANYGKITVTVSHTATMAPSADGTVASAAAIVSKKSMELAAVSGAVSGLSVKRESGGIVATWRGPGSPGLGHQFQLRVNVGTSGSPQWVWVFTATDLSSVATLARATTLPGDAGANWGRWSWTVTDLDESTLTGATWTGPGGASYTLTADQLNGANGLRVQTRVTGAGAWTASTDANIPGS